MSCPKLVTVLRGMFKRQWKIKSNNMVCPQHEKHDIEEDHGTQHSIFTCAVK